MSPWPLIQIYLHIIVSNPFSSSGATVEHINVQTLHFISLYYPSFLFQSCWVKNGVNKYLNTQFRYTLKKRPTIN